MWARVVNVSVGVSLVAAPSVLGYSGWLSDWHRIAGATAAAAAWVAASQVTSALRVVNFVLGAGVVASAWAGAPEAEIVMVSGVSGIVMIGAASVAVKTKRSIGGGWKALRDPLNRP